MKYDTQKAQEYFAKKMAFTTGTSELNGKINNKEDISIIDVRDPEAYAKGHVPGAVNLPKGQWSSLKGLNKDKVNVLYCYSQTCHLAASAALEFSSQGYPVMEMEGGFSAWKDGGYPVHQTGNGAHGIQCLC